MQQKPRRDNGRMLEQQARLLSNNSSIQRDSLMNASTPGPVYLFEERSESVYVQHWSYVLVIACSAAASKQIGSNSFRVCSSILLPSCEHVTMCHLQAMQPCAFGQRPRKRPQKCESRASSKREHPGAKMQPSELKRNSHRAGESTRAQGRGKAQQRGRSTRRPRKEGRGKAKEKEAEGKGKTEARASSKREHPGAKMQPSELKRNSHRAGESTRAQGRGKAQQRGRSTRRPRKEGRGKAKEKEAEGKGKTQDKGRGLHSLNAPCGRGPSGDAALCFRTEAQEKATEMRVASQFKARTPGG